MPYVLQKRWERFIVGLKTSYVQNVASRNVSLNLNMIKIISCLEVVGHIQSRTAKLYTYMFLTNSSRLSATARSTWFVATSPGPVAAVKVGKSRKDDSHQLADVPGLKVLWSNFLYRHHIHSCNLCLSQLALHSLGNLHLLECKLSKCILCRLNIK